MLQSSPCSDLTVDYRSGPLGLDQRRPVFRWRLRGEVPDEVCVVVEEAGEEIWRSEWMEAAHVPFVEYAGPPLRSATLYTWTVETRSGGLRARSEPSTFETGLLEEKDWRGAHWIGAGALYVPEWSFLLRREFCVRTGIRRARAYVTGVGYHEFFCNGEKCGDDLLSPPQTDYHQRVFYFVHDLTGRLVEGENAVGFFVGDGFYHQSRHRDTPGMVDGHGIHGRPAAIGLIRVDYEDGTSDEWCTDGTWMVARGPIVQNNVFAGETYDARLEQSGWCEAGFAARDWQVASIEAGPRGKLWNCPIPPVRRTGELAPVGITEKQKGIYIFDFGENLTGWVQLKCEGYPGVEVTLRYAEVLDPAGYPDFDSGGTFHTKVIQCDRYVFGGEGAVVHEPRFTYHGFRYVEVIGFPGVPDAKNLRAVRVNTDLTKHGTFACSNQTLNTLHTMARRTITNNLHGIPTDCPIRERCGWTGDAWLIAETMLYNFDAASFLQKYAEDIESSRAEYGEWSQVVPGRRTCLQAGPLWALAQILVPWQVYLFEGNPSVLRKHYKSMCEWVAHYAVEIEKTPPSFQLVGDHAAPIHIKPSSLTVPEFARGAFCHGVTLVARIARVLGEEKDAERFEGLAAESTATMQRLHYDAARRTFGDQSLDAMAIAAGFCPEGHEADLAAAIAESIRQHGDHFIAGAVGMRYIFQALSEHGNADLIARVLEVETYPGFKQQIREGATTLWETWENDGSQNDSSRSHPFKGGFDGWLFSHVLGIAPLEPGFARFRIAPVAHAVAHWASGHVCAPQGEIAVRWEKLPHAFLLDAEVPPGTSAEVVLPVEDTAVVTVGGISTTGASVTVGPGKHHIEATLGVRSIPAVPVS